jgi:hypothetical protein
MIRRERLINKLADLNYRWSCKFRNVEEYKQVGSTNRAYLPLHDLLEDDFVFEQLCRAGVEEEEARAFVGSNQAPAYH